MPVGSGSGLPDARIDLLLLRVQFALAGALQGVPAAGDSAV